MMRWRDPPRLSEPGSNAPAVLREVLREARAYRVSSAEVRYLAASFPYVVREAVSSSQAPPASAVAQGSACMATTKVLGVALTVGLVGTAVWQGGFIGSPRAPGQAPAPAMSVSASAGSQPAAVQPGEAGEQGAEDRDRSVAEQPSAPPAPGASSPAAPARSTGQKARARRMAKSRPSRHKGSVVDELRLLRRAQQALELQPRQSLRLVGEHERLYGSGVLTQEREMLAVEALLKLGRRDAAVRRGQLFMQQYPASAHVRRIQNLFKQYPLQRRHRDTHGQPTSEMR